MAEMKYSTEIKNLFQEYYKRNLSMGEYRAQRNKIIDRMDDDYNGAMSLQEGSSNSDTNKINHSMSLD